eukprot:jgi/Bigna1/136479/aug1.34_g11187
MSCFNKPPPLQVICTILWRDIKSELKRDKFAMTMTQYEVADLFDDMVDHYRVEAIESHMVDMAASKFNLWGFNVVSFLLHGVNAILTVIDVGVSASPYRLAHVYQPLILALVYSIWTIIHAYARIDNGHLDGIYIYEFLDYDRDPRAWALLFITFPVTVPGLYIISWLINWVVDAHGVWSSWDSNTRRGIVKAITETKMSMKEGKEIQEDEVEIKADPSSPANIGGKDIEKQEISHQMISNKSMEQRSTTANLDEN